MARSRTKRVQITLEAADDAALAAANRIDSHIDRLAYDIHTELARLVELGVAIFEDEALGAEFVPLESESLESITRATTRTFERAMAADYTLRSKIAHSIRPEPPQNPVASGNVIDLMQERRKAGKQAAPQPSTTFLHDFALTTGTANLIGRLNRQARFAAIPPEQFMQKLLRIGLERKLGNLRSRLGGIEAKKQYLLELAQTNIQAGQDYQVLILGIKEWEACEQLLAQTESLSGESGDIKKLREIAATLRPIMAGSRERVGSNKDKAVWQTVQKTLPHLKGRPIIFALPQRAYDMEVLPALDFLHEVQAKHKAAAALYRHLTRAINLGHNGVTGIPGRLLPLRPDPQKPPRGSKPRLVK